MALTGQDQSLTPSCCRCRSGGSRRAVNCLRAAGSRAPAQLEIMSLDMEVMPEKLCVAEPIVHRALCFVQDLSQLFYYWHSRL